MTKPNRHGVAWTAYTLSRRWCTECQWNLWSCLSNSEKSRGELESLFHLNTSTTVVTRYSYSYHTAYLLFRLYRDPRDVPACLHGFLSPEVGITFIHIIKSLVTDPIPTCLSILLIHIFAELADQYITIQITPNHRTRTKADQLLLLVLLFTVLV